MRHTSTQADETHIMKVTELYGSGFRTVVVFRGEPFLFFVSLVYFVVATSRASKVVRFLADFSPTKSRKRHCSGRQSWFGGGFP
jgi:hypothetical protein